MAKIATGSGDEDTYDVVRSCQVKPTRILAGHRHQNGVCSHGGSNDLLPGAEMHILLGVLQLEFERNYVLPTDVAVWNLSPSSFYLQMRLSKSLEQGGAGHRQVMQAFLMKKEGAVPVFKYTAKSDLDSERKKVSNLQKELESLGIEKTKLEENVQSLWDKVNENQEEIMSLCSRKFVLETQLEKSSQETSAKYRKSEEKKEESSFIRVRRIPHKDQVREAFQEQKNQSLKLPRPKIKLK
ncbi:hypothetical protein Tco_0281514 [Tanacetum coccineum]